MNRDRLECIQAGACRLRQVTLALVPELPRAQRLLRRARRLESDVLGRVGWRQQAVVVRVSTGASRWLLVVCIVGGDRDVVQGSSALAQTCIDLDVAEIDPALGVSAGGYVRMARGGDRRVTTVLGQQPVLGQPVLLHAQFALVHPVHLTARPSDLRTELFERPLFGQLFLHGNAWDQ